MRENMSERDLLFRKFQIQKFDRKRSAPAVSMTVDIDVTKVQEIREQYNQAGSQSEKISFTHVMIKSVAKVLTKFPVLYSAFDGRKVIHADRIKINLPVEEENHVEYVVIESPELKTLGQIAFEVRNEMERIRNGQGTFYLYLKKLMKIPYFVRKIATNIPAFGIRFLKNYYGNFPITNFGSFGVKNGTPAIASPIIGVLCIGTIQKQLVAADGNQLDTQSILPVTVVFDHRPMDGAYGGHFLTTIKELLEQNPESVFE
jgi:pyruvate/2-oxoglutarate dehydrogenase complex dihydrolipoamide acyltransferase (E2) component